MATTVFSTDVGRPQDVSTGHGESVQPIAGSHLDFLWLEVTPKCNLLCKHCYADAGPDRGVEVRMGVEDWLRIIEAAASLGCAGIQFIGGEPTLYPRLGDLVAAAADVSFRFIEVFTNATALTDRILDVLVCHDVRVACSFYSADPATHDRITTRPGSFHWTVCGMQKVLSRGLKLRAGIIEMEENRGHASEARRFLEALGVPSIGEDRERRVGRGMRGQQPPSEPLDELCGACWRGKLCVTASGDAYPCVFARTFPLGSVLSGLRQVLEGEPLRRFRENAREHFRCPTASARCRPECAPNCYPNQW